MIILIKELKVFAEFIYADNIFNLSLSLSVLLSASIEWLIVAGESPGVCSMKGEWVLEIKSQKTLVNTFR